jgi:menaquinone-specific isochorismate synthase
LFVLKNAIKILQNKIIDAHPEQMRVTVDLKLQTPVHLIEWLGEQVLYPQFYWQSRGGEEEVVALGQHAHFTDATTAKGCLGPQQRIWGGRPFQCQPNAKATSTKSDVTAAYYFLPQIELICTHEQWQLAVNLNTVGSTATVHTDLLQSLNALVIDCPVRTAEPCHIQSRVHSPDLSQWSGLVNKALTAIEQQQFAKVVLARQTTLTLSQPLSAARFLQQSRQLNQQCFHFMFALNKHDYFIGSTPERLYARTDSILDTEALAGTAARGLDVATDAALADWLLHDEKNRYENRLVVDDLVSRLKSRCVSLRVSALPELVKLRKVQHLKHLIMGQLKADVDDAELLDSLQPSAAIAGLPREQALAFIADNEPFSREWYSGALGYLGQQQSEFCVAIRSARVQSHELQLFAGAGIVPGSTALSEWQELDRKTATLLSLIEPDTGVINPSGVVIKPNSVVIKHRNFATEQQRA